MAIKVILIDDEAGVRLLLRKIIEKHSAENQGNGEEANFEIVGESDNLADAVTLFTRTQPDVVFLDIDINGASEDLEKSFVAAVFLPSGLRAEHGNNDIVKVTAEDGSESEYKINIEKNIKNILCHFSNICINWIK